ncbi:hypothetical protein ACL02S_01500 [Nocardia sp. 004]|uniref:hypothetical protein n=1 Tax=Nocardia sp. 004 TaxID=3385978 RepID=UPI0039A2A066
MRFSPIALAVIAGAAIASTTSAASAEPPTQAPVSYHSTIDGLSVTTTLDNGTFAATARPGSIAVQDAVGTELDTIPLTFALDGQQLPIDYQLSADRRTVTLTPDITELRRTELHPVASPLENQLAMNDLINAVSIGTSIGSLIGTAIGAVAGVGIGFALAGASCLVINLGCVVAVLPLVTLVGAVGGVTGLVLAGGGSTAYALFDYVTTLQAPPGQSKYAQHLPASTAPGR